MDAVKARGRFMGVRRADILVLIIPQEDADDRRRWKRMILYPIFGADFCHIRRRVVMDVVRAKRE